VAAYNNRSVLIPEGTE